MRMPHHKTPPGGRIWALSSIIPMPGNATDPPPRMGHVQHQAKFLSFSPSIRHKMPTRRGHGEMLPFPIINEGQGGAPKALG